MKVAVSSKHYLRLIGDVHRVGTWALDCLTGQVELSPSMLKLLRVEERSAFGLDALLDVVDPQDAWLVRDLLALDAVGVREDRVRIRRADGEERWLHVSVEIARDTHGRPEVQFGAACDVTEQQGSRFRLSQHLEALDRMAQTFGGMGWRVGPRGGLFWSDSARAFTGRPLSELRGLITASTVHPDDRPGAVAAWRHSQQTAEPLDEVLRFERAGGGYAPLRVVMEPLRSAKGEVLEWIACALPVAAPAPAAAADLEGADPRPSPAELRGARGLLGWSVERLATASDVSAATITRYETGREATSPVRASTLAKLRHALEANGVLLLGEEGGPRGVGLAAPEGT